MPRSMTAPAIRTVFIAIAALGALTYVVSGTAEARHRHGGRVVVHIGSGFGVGVMHRHHHHARLVVVGGGPRCGWLYRKAVRSGASYWWDRYEDCRYGS